MKALLRSAERVYAPLKAGFYGLHSVLLCLVIMALLRIKNIERLSIQWSGSDCMVHDTSLRAAGDGLAAAMLEVAASVWRRPR